MTDRVTASIARSLHRLELVSLEGLVNIGVLVLISLCLVGCARRGDAAAEVPDGFDPCSLLTPSEAQGLVGVLFAPPVATGSRCDYETPPTANDFAQVTLKLLSVKGSSAEEVYELGFEDAIEVPGLGDRARCSEGKLVSTLMVLSGERVLQVVASSCGEARAIADAAVPRLP